MSFCYYCNDLPRQEFAFKVSKNVTRTIYCCRQHSPLMNSRRESSKTSQLDEMESDIKTDKWNITKGEEFAEQRLKEYEEENKSNYRMEIK